MSAVSLVWLGDELVCDTCFNVSVMLAPQPPSPLEGCEGRQGGCDGAPLYEHDGAWWCEECAPAALERSQRELLEHDDDTGAMLRTALAAEPMPRAVELVRAVMRAVRRQRRTHWARRFRSHRGAAFFLVWVFVSAVACGALEYSSEQPTPPLAPSLAQLPTPSPASMPGPALVQAPPEPVRSASCYVVHGAVSDHVLRCAPLLTAATTCAGPDLVGQPAQLCTVNQFAGEVCCRWEFPARCVDTADECQAECQAELELCAGGAP